MSTGVDLTLQNRLTPGDQKLLQMAEHFDQFIMAHEMANPSVWRDRLPKGTFELFNGTSQKTNIFRGTLGPQQGLNGWTSVEPSRKPTAGDPAGFDYCAYNPQTYTWAMDTVTFSGLRSSWRSPVFCVNDLKFVDQARQQLAFIVRAGARVVDDSKEVFNRENYVQTAVNAGKAIVLAEGANDYVDNPAYRFAYDPFALDGSGNTYLTFPSALLPKISTINWTFLDFIRTYLADQAPETATGRESGMPIFTLMMDLLDFDRYVLNNTELREDFRYAQPQQLIDGFEMGFKVFRGFALVHDPRQMRFTVTSDDGTNVTATRVVPRRATRVGTIGLIPETNPDYINAELGVGVIFMNQVIQILVPPNLSNLGSGLTFGPAPGYNGEWTWINEYDKDVNPLKEVGYFFSRMEFFVKPLIYSNEATVFLYRRCPQTLGSGCAVEAAVDSASSSGVATDAVAGDVSATNKTIVLTLSSKLTAGLGDPVTVTDDDGGSGSGNVADASQAPTYKFVFSDVSSFTGGALNYAKFTAAGTSNVAVV